MATTVRRRRRSTYNLRPAAMSTKRIVLFAVMLIVAIVGTYGVRVVGSLAKLTHQSPAQVIGDLVSGGHNSGVQAQAVDLHRINLAMYGYGGAGHDGAYLTDSIMIVSIQPKVSGPPDVSEISIPRDWYVPIPLKNGQSTNQRINFAYSAGMDNEGPVSPDQPNAGAAVADPTLESLLGIHIDHYVAVDFSAFKQAVDAVGGVDITVPTTFTDYQYPAGECGGYNSNCGFMTVHFKAGPAHLTGNQALIFSRSRHGDNGEGSDFARSHRQQLVLAALKQKVVSIGGIGNLPDLLTALGDNVSTDLTVADMEALYKLVKDVDPATVKHVSVDNTNFLYDCGYPTHCGAYYLYAHDRTGESLHHFVANVFPADDVLGEKAAVTIQDGSHRGTAASGRWSTLFNDIGLVTTDGGAVPLSATTQVIDSSGGRDTKTAQWLADYFGVKVTTVARPSAPTSTVTTSTAPPSVTLIIGAAAEKTFNNLNGKVSN